MISVDLVKVLGGFGLFLYSLRILTQVLQRSLSRRIRGALSHTLATPLRCLMAGILATALVQASSITVMASMGLVGSTLISLEQGFFLVLGASLGTTLKAWLVSADLLKAGPLLVGFGSISQLFTKKSHWREFLEGVLAVGFALWGMLLLTEGLVLLNDSPEIQDWVFRHPGDTLYNQILAVLVGTILTAIVQSSSTIVILAITLAGAGSLAFPQAAALVLGANIGTTLVPLLASLEHARSMRRLAIGYWLTKVIGVAITMFFFPQFLHFVLICVPQDWPIQQQVAAVHTGFNLINVIWWSIFSGLFLRFIERTLPDRDLPDGSGLAPVVRKILSRSSARSLQEAQRQISHVTDAVKVLLDRCGALLRGESAQTAMFEARVLEQREFENLKDSTYELLTQAGRLTTDESSADRQEIRRRLYELSYFEELFYEAWRLREQLEFGLVREGLVLPDDLKLWLSRFQRAVDEYWLCIIFPDQAGAPGEESQTFLATLENHYFEHLSQGGGPDWESSLWAFDVLNGIRELLYRLRRVRPDVASPVEEGGPGREPNPTA